MKYRGFTLIELLIVVAIIAILAAIAVPNFLEAQTRAKVAKGVADMRTLATAIESYRIDITPTPLMLAMVRAESGVPTVSGMATQTPPQITLSGSSLLRRLRISPRRSL